LNKIQINLEYNFLTTHSPIIIKFNEHVLYNGVCNQNKFTFFVDGFDKNNEIQIHLLRKNSDETQIIDGKIISDTFIKINNIIINDHSMRHLVNDFGKIIIDYSKNLGAYEYYIKNNIVPVNVLDKVNVLSLVAYYSFCFELPINEWLKKYYKQFDFVSDITYIQKLKNLSLKKLKKLDNF